MKPDRWIAKLKTQERVDLAKLKVDALVDRVLAGMATRASNRAMKFPNGIDEVSRAAVCFNHLFASQLKFEALMVGSIWDRQGKDRNSIPTVIALVSDSDILDVMRDNARNQYPTHGLTGQLTMYYQQRRAEEVGLFDERWHQSQEACDRITSDLNFLKLREFRDYEIAHTISGDEIEIDRNTILLAEPFWKDTIDCVSNLYSVIRLTSFDFSYSQQINTKNANAFWESVVFSKFRTN
jgi:AbiU2